MRCFGKWEGADKKKDKRDHEKLRLHAQMSVIQKSEDQAKPESDQLCKSKKL